MSTRAIVVNSFGSEQTVTASGLVRQFGLWQEAATRAPVYVLHRGRARLVLTSVDIMAALCAPRSGDMAHHAACERCLIDTIAEPAMIVDADLRLVAVGRAARGYFGEHAVDGAALAVLLPADAAPFVTGAARRVLATGMGENVDLRNGPHPGRRLELAVEPHPLGALIVGRDRSVEDDRDDAAATTGAMVDALATIPGVAVARVGLRGYVDQADRALGRLSGVSGAALAGVRFVTLFAVASRVALGEAIEAVIAGGMPRCVEGTLLVNPGDPVPVHVGLSAIRRGPALEAVLAVVAVAWATGFRDA